MTAEPEYPIISTDDLKPGQEFRHGWATPWKTATKDTATVPSTWASWVEAKPPPIQVGDRVRHKDDDWTATVRYVGTHFLAVQVDGLPYEDVWEAEQVERIGDDQ